MTDTVEILLNRLERLAVELGNARAERDRLARQVEAVETRIADAETRANRAPSPDNIHELIGYMAEGRKIEAIKCHRFLTGYGLKESKDAIESVMSRAT